MSFHDGIVQDDSSINMGEGHIKTDELMCWFSPNRTMINRVRF